MTEKFDILFKQFYASLALDRKIIGIQLIKDAPTFDNIQVDIPTNPMNYCGMVKAASCGHSLKGKSEHFKCRSGPRVLGIDPSDPLNAQGENWVRLGLYENAELSKEIRDNLNYNTETEIYGLVVRPLEQFDSVPDVILVVTNPYNVMRILQGYAYHNGAPPQINMLGNQAICLESTVQPYLSKGINVSVMCIGTRHRSGWKDEEMVVGISGEKFTSTVNGLVATINPMENNANKKRIEDRFRESDLGDIDLRYNYNYYQMT